MVFLRKGQTKAGRKPEDLNVNVVNMIDVMMILITFLLMSSAVQSYSIAATPDLIPPLSRAAEGVTYGTEVAVTDKAVLLDGQLMEPNFKDYEDKDEPLLAGLDAGLRRKIEGGAGRGNDPVTGGPVPGNVVTIRADKRVLFRQIQKVMYTCNQAGFDKIEFTALKDGS